MPYYKSMKLGLRIIFILVFFLSGFQSLAWTSDYVPIFKPAQKIKTVSEIQMDIKQDVFQFRSLMNLEEKKIIGLIVKERADTEKSKPADI